jgi:hypothetical protein
MKQNFRTLEGCKSIALKTITLLASLHDAYIYRSFPGVRYELRDYALEIAEHIAGQRFESGDCLEQRNGATISWRSWSAFTRWLDSTKKFSLFGYDNVA